MTGKRFRLRLFHVAAAVAAACFASHAFAQDEVVGPTGITTKGNIRALSRTQVTIVDNAGVEKTFMINELRRDISFADDPLELRQARDHIANGRFKDAKTELANIKVADVRAEYVKEDIAFYNALVEARMALSGEGGDKAKAVVDLTAFINNENYARGYHYFTAVETLADVAAAMSRFDKSEEYYQQLFNEIPWPEDKARALVRLAESQLSQKKYKEALDNFAKVENASLNTPAALKQKQFAKVGRAMCMAADKPDEAIALVEGIIRDEDPRDMALFGRAYNALGACYRQQNKNKDALLAYLHVDILFYSDREAHAEALYWLTQLWSEVNKSDRALRAKALLRSHYAGSRWAELVN